MISSLVENDWLTVILFTLMGLLAVIHFIDEERFIKFISILKINEYFVDYNHRKASFIGKFNLLTFIFQWVVYTIFLLFILAKYKNIDFVFSSFYRLFFLVLLFYIFRYAIGRLLAFIFELGEAQGILTFVKFTYLAKTAIYIMPLLVVSFYSPYFKNTLLTVNIVLSVVFLAFFYIKLLVHNQKIIIRNLLYFILYFCILEITPLVYLIQVINFIDWA